MIPPTRFPRHFSPTSPRVIMSLLLSLLIKNFLLIVSWLGKVHGLCGSSIRWSHHFNIEDVFGFWNGVSYAQHTPDMTNRPNHVGCVTLYITDATTDINDDWLNWSIQRRNYTDRNWLSQRSNPFSNTALSGSWLDVRVKRRVRRDIYDQRRVRVLWDEDGQTMEQTYLYAPEEPGLWTLEQLYPMERELRSRGIDLWYPDDPPRHPEVIRILKVSQDSLILNHCSEAGDGGIFSLIMRRSPEPIDRWQWYDLQREFHKFDLPTVHRHETICAGCLETMSVLCLVICFFVLKIF